MQLYMRLAWRNIWRHRRRTIIVVLAMALGLSMMMIYDDDDGAIPPAAPYSILVLRSCMGVVPLDWSPIKKRNLKIK